MASFDIIAASSRAYKTTWSARAYLLRLAVVPFFLKLVCFTIAASYAGEAHNHLRFMLIMLPALLAEGWMLAHLARFLTLGQTWPFRPSGDLDADLSVLAVRARGVLSGMLVFVLINMALGLVMAFMSVYILPYFPSEPSGAMPEIPPAVALFSFVFLFVLFWGFRLFWLYIPYALNMDGRTYLSALRGWMTSLHMMGAWVLCFIPFLLGLQLLVGIIAVPISTALGESAGSFVVIILSVFVDIIKGIVTTAGITFGLQEIFAKHKTAGR